MSDWPPDLAVPITVWTGSRYGLAVQGREFTGSGSAFATVAPAVANLALFVPVRIPFRYPVRRLFIGNGTTVNGNVDVGVYSEDLVKIVSSGSVAHAGASALQFFPTAGAFDVVLDPGLYYFALATSSTTAAFAISTLGAAAVSRLRYLGAFEQLTAFPLPAVATPASLARLMVPLIGTTPMASPTF